MKIGILTQPLHDNYGGLLQAYALKEILKNLSHDVVIINRVRTPSNPWRIIASKIKHTLKGSNLPKAQPLPALHKSIISQHTSAFREKYIPEQSHLITSNKEMKKLNNDDFDAFIVGSDQCWRPRYSPQIENFFLDFAESVPNIKRISYAASFGTSNWEFTVKQTNTCKKLLGNFDAISVREKSGVKLVEQHLGRSDAIHVLDPTMLLAKEHYQQIIEQENPKTSKGNLKVYVLDKTTKKNAFISDIEQRLGMKQFEVMPKKRLQSNTVTDDTAVDFQYPSPAQWLKGFADANFVITDSFHGTVFSILFNIPFVSIANVHRGSARFESVLGMFGLSNRLVTDINDINIDDLLNTEINWEDVNAILKSERVKAIHFLTSNLN